MHRSRGLALALAFGTVCIVAACAVRSVERRNSQAASVMLRETASVEREIYALVVAHAFEGGRPDTLFLVSESPVYRDLPLNNFLRRGKAVVPPPLPARLSALSADGTPVEVQAFPAPARMLPAARARRLAGERLGGTKVLAVTPVAFADDSSQALVYYEIWCGSLCGGGYELWLVRGLGGQWQLRQDTTHWVS